MNSNARRYDISGVELLTNDSYLAVDYPVNKSYTYTGYAVGYGIDGNNVESTLNCKPEKLSTIKLNVEHTFYRTMTSKKGADWQNQIDTAYFSVHQDFFKDESVLQRIKAEWFEYKTKPIVVTCNNEFYEKAFAFIGKNIGNYVHTGLGLYENKDYDKKILEYGLIADKATMNAGSVSYYNIAWNTNDRIQASSTFWTCLYYLLKCENIENYDPYADKIDEFENKLYKYILEYRKYDKGRLPIKGGNISADLFEDDIDDNRKVDNEAGKIQNGYSYYEFDGDYDVTKLYSWSSTNPSFWDNLKEFGLWDTIFGNIPDEEIITLKPIEIFDYNDIKLGDAELIKKYYINAKDLDNFKEYARKAQLRSENVVLFRFATSDYYVTEAEITKTPYSVPILDETYIAQQSVFFNFDIIQLTFKQGDVYTVIPVVSSPIDIVDDPTPPINIKPDNPITDWFKKVLTWILIIVAGVFLIKIIVWIANAIPKKQKVVIKTDSNGNSKRKRRWKHRE